MSEHDEAGRAVAFPPFLPPPPPPQPAARSASTAVRPISAASNGLLLTLPPQSPIPVPRRTRQRGPAPRVAKYRANRWGSQAPTNTGSPPPARPGRPQLSALLGGRVVPASRSEARSEEHTSELQSRPHLECRLPRQT